MPDLWKKLLFILLGVIFFAFLAQHPSDDDIAEKKYFERVDLQLTGIVKTIAPETEQDNGVAYLIHVKTNKDSVYETYFEDQYLFCKTDYDKAILVTSWIGSIEPGDSVVINTSTNKYLIYRNGKIIAKPEFTMYTYDTFYGPLKSKGYLEFSTYEKPK